MVTHGEGGSVSEMMVEVKNYFKVIFDRNRFSSVVNNFLTSINQFDGYNLSRMTSCVDEIRSTFGLRMQ